MEWLHSNSYLPPENVPWMVGDLRRGPAWGPLRIGMSHSNWDLNGLFQLRLECTIPIGIGIDYSNWDWNGPFKSGLEATIPLGHFHFKFKKTTQIVSLQF